MKFRLLSGLLLALAVNSAAHAETVYLTQEDFLQQAFAGDVPAPKTVWWVGDKKQRVQAALNAEPLSLRSRYWQRDNRSAWVLEAIGKELPITAGVVIDNNEIVAVEILVYRESRGWEVRLPAFRAQFDGVALSSSPNKPAQVPALDSSIDGISGATLSVRALTGMARLALAMHHELVAGDAG